MAVKTRASRATGEAVAAAVFLDKDGTLVEDVPFNVDPDRIRFTPGALEGLRMLHDAGYRLVVVSNQPGVAMGMFDEQALAKVAGYLARVMEAAGARLSGFYFCPHPPASTTARPFRPCRCRKPAPGLLLRAAADLGLELGQSWLAGDILDDIEAGCRAGCRTVLVDNGGETEWRIWPNRRPHHIVGNLHEAATTILGNLEPAGETGGFSGSGEGSGHETA